MSMQRAAGSIAEVQGSTFAMPLVLPVDPVGQILRGCYRIERRLAVGSVTEIYQAYNLKRQQLCVIKLLRRDADPKLEPQRRFEQEASIISRLSHAHIAEAHRFAHTEDGQPFMVMEALRGITLQDLLAEEKTLPLAKTLQLIEAIGSALQHAHEVGVLHPSIRPGSIFLHRQRESDEDFTVKLFDFGLASELSAAGAPARGPWPLGIIVGTPGYLPPEALQTDAQVNELADQWSLAVLAYRTLTGRLPFQSSDPYLMCALIRTTEPAPLQALRPELPAHICEAINRAMSREPALRFARMQDFLRALTVPREPAPRTLRRTERPEAPQTKKFESRDLIELCRQEVSQDEAVPEPVQDGDSTNPYSQAERSRLLTLAQSEPLDGKAEVGKAPASRRPWAMGLALVTLLSALLGLALARFGQSRPKVMRLEAATSELVLARGPARPAFPSIPFAVDSARSESTPDRAESQERALSATRPKPRPAQEVAVGVPALPMKKRAALEHHAAPGKSAPVETAPALPPHPTAAPAPMGPPEKTEDAPRQIQMVD